MTLRSEAACQACGAVGMTEFHSEDRIPTNSCLLLASRSEAESFPTGDMRLAFCDVCGFISNLAFDPGKAEYSGRYEETQGFSGVFMDFARDLARRWVREYDLVGKSVLEIGCGKGEFLTMMVEEGAGTGVGIDPGVNVERIDTAVGERLTWIADFYSEEYAHLKADAVVCRHTLEHIPDVGAFMRLIRASIADDAVVLFELPDVLRVLEEVAFWDVYYEHCSYFSVGSLTRLFRSTGFEVLNVELAYDDQYLIIEARPSATPAGGAPIPGEDDMGLLRAGVERFRTEFTRTRSEWRDQLRGLRDAGGKAVIWGAGSKGVSYLTNLGLREEIEYAVDINPYKSGMYMAGTGQEIVSPEFLVAYRPDRVIVMNPIYVEEITETLDELGLSPEVSAV